MNKITAADAGLVDNAQPANQALLLGTRILELDSYGNFQITVTIAAGTAGKVTQPLLGVDPNLQFDFEVTDVLVRTETTVASSTLQVKKGATAVSDAIVSATANALTRAGTIDPAQNQFKPKTAPAAYAANPLNLVDAGGATAPKRTVTVFCRKI